MFHTGYWCKFFWFFTITITTTISTKTKPKLLVLLIDGLRYDSVHNETLSGFSSLKNRGVTADHLIPNFPSTGYPNYFTLLTGLYPEQHGITDEYMYDYSNQTYFIKGAWYDSNGSTIHRQMNGEPFWKTASDHGRNVSMYWWPGCTGTNGIIPMDHCQDFGQQDLNNTEHVITSVLDQFQHGSLDISFIHIDEVDFYGHGDSPNGGRYGEAVSKVDAVIQHLEGQLLERNMANLVNVVVLSVYGFRSMIRPTTIIELSNFLPEINSSLSFVEGGSHVPLYPPKDRIISTFNKLYGRHRHLRVYWKYNTPEEWRIRNGPFVAPILMVADPGWVLAVSPKEALKQEKYRGGYNGYDPDVSADMWGVFIAAGPSFKKNSSQSHIHIKDVYNLLCFASGLTPSENEGDMKFVSNVLEPNLGSFAVQHFPQHVNESITFENETSFENFTVDWEPNDTGNSTSVPHELLDALKTTTEHAKFLIKIKTTTDSILGTTHKNSTEEHVMISGSGDDDFSGNWGGNISTSTEESSTDGFSGDDHTTAPMEGAFTDGHSGDGSGEDTTAVDISHHDSKQSAPLAESSGWIDEPFMNFTEIHMTTNKTMEENAESSGITNEIDSGSAETDPSESKELFDEPESSGQFEIDNRLTNDENRRLIRKTVEDFKKLFINDVLDDEGLMEFSPKVKKFHTGNVRQNEPSIGAFHLSLVEEPERIVERMPEGQTRMVHTKIQSIHGGSGKSNRKVNTINIDQYNVKAKGKMTRFKLQSPNVNLNFN